MFKEQKQAKACFHTVHREKCKTPNLNWAEDDAVWLSTAIIILANYESSFIRAFNRANEEFKNK